LLAVGSRFVSYSAVGIVVNIVNIVVEGTGCTDFFSKTAEEVAVGNKIDVFVKARGAKIKAGVVGIAVYASGIFGESLLGLAGIIS